LLCQEAVHKYISSKDYPKYSKYSEKELIHLNKVMKIEEKDESEPRLKNIMTMSPQLRRSSSDDKLYAQNYSKNLEMTIERNDKNPKFSPETCK